MDAYTIRDAAEQLDHIVGRVESGESIDLSRGGRVVARLIPAPPPIEAGQPIDWKAYRAWADANLQFDPTNSVVEMRKQARF